MTYPIGTTHAAVTALQDSGCEANAYKAMAAFRDRAVKLGKGQEMFEKVEDYPVDPIMIGADYFAQDPRTDKLNLTVGIYQDEHGQTPVLQAVKKAERRLVETQTSKSYLALTGDAEYCSVLAHEILGATCGGDWVELPPENRTLT